MEKKTYYMLLKDMVLRQHDDPMNEMEPDLRIMGSLEWPPIIDTADLRVYASQGNPEIGVWLWFCVGPES